MINYKLSLDDIDYADVTVVFRYRGGVEFKATPIIIKSLLNHSAKLVDQALDKMRNTNET